VNIFEIEIWDDEGQSCTFYTVRWEDAEHCETDKFLLKYGSKSHKYYEQTLSLVRLISKSIGNRYGATDDFIDRAKNRAYALPPRPKKKPIEIRELGIHFPLRLYCYKVSESLLILFNGGIKDARTDQDSKDLSTKFYEAEQFVRRIEDALQEEMIIYNQELNRLETYKGETEIIL
jgi:hypothetical protein